MKTIYKIAIVHDVLCYLSDSEANKNFMVPFPKEFFGKELENIIIRMCDIDGISNKIITLTSQGVYINGVDKNIVDNLACKDFSQFWANLQEVINMSFDELCSLELE